MCEVKSSVIFSLKEHQRHTALLYALSLPSPYIEELSLEYLVLQVEADDKYERIGGTSMGGGTFWGLGSLLTKAKGFDELLQLASEGDHRNVDLLVKDIYGMNAALPMMCLLKK